MDAANRLSSDTTRVDCGCLINDRAMPRRLSRRLIFGDAALKSNTFYPMMMMIAIMTARERPLLVLLLFMQAFWVFGQLARLDRMLCNLFWLVSHHDRIAPIYRGKSKAISHVASALGSHRHWETSRFVISFRGGDCICLSSETIAEHLQIKW